MRFAVLVFPGSNCDRDLCHAVTAVMGQDAAFVDYRETTLTGFDAVLVPGGFSYGDYLRAGVIARFAPVMTAVAEFARAGGLVLGICNGFQILTEAGLLPGALHQNAGLSFICEPERLVVENADTPFTRSYEQGQEVTFPIAHGEGNYFCDAATYRELQAHHQVVFSYAANPNGSVHNIAGICNRAGNVMALMPHPERAVEAILGGTDGRGVFTSMIEEGTRHA
ncbi:phosphoribosylformylglycinamidine synthase subunit PurQ [Neoactinobaculum massilliense]|uniref:phosphoribosylformylglycinamidine synthase subunit PurQ n=1 Tax=Neoactinobaculum massilliense TaxID=2364794 RepID=UPI000F526BDB|nr:phosphoribosylformylglycinamidine synthase subunit PurQ [Neoactinobaculum massilliense]